MIPSALPGGSPATVAALRDVLGIELLQAALVASIAALAIIAAFPELTLFLPRMWGML